jgi:hypothetical protein
MKSNNYWFLLKIKLNNNHFTLSVLSIFQQSNFLNPLENSTNVSLFSFNHIYNILEI